MTDEARLLRAMAQASPPARDPAFVVATLERAERERFRAEGARAVLRGAGLAAAAAAPALLLLGWVQANAPAVMEGLLATAALMMFVSMARGAVGRATARP